jgi:hypothetical protein
VNNFEEWILSHQPFLFNVNWKGLGPNLPECLSMYFVLDQSLTISLAFIGPGVTG